MKSSPGFLRSIAVITPCLATIVVGVGCSSDGTDVPGGGGRPPAGTAGSSGAPQTAGAGTIGGAPGTGGKAGTAGSATAAGAPSIGEGGRSGGPSVGGGGAGSGFGGKSGGFGGKSGGFGGRPGVGGSTGSGGSSGSGGKAGGSAGAPAVGDPCAATGPLTGGTKVETSNRTGKAAGLDWALWSNGTGGSITTYSVPAFSATWANSGDFLARLGLQWNSTKTYDQYGTITAQFNYTRTGTAGGFSYIGMYGWSVSPCVEWYIVDDSWNKMPFNPGMTTNKGTLDVDGGKYTLYTRSTTGTGGSKCGSETSWMQFYSIRQTARTCGTISVTAHFDAWAAAGMVLGKMDQAQILLEVGGGTGTADFTVANVTATMP